MIAPGLRSSVGQDGPRQCFIYFLFQDARGLHCMIASLRILYGPQVPPKGVMAPPHTKSLWSFLSWPFLLQQKSKLPRDSDVTKAGLMAAMQGSHGYLDDKNHVSHPAPTPIAPCVFTQRTCTGQELLPCARQPLKENQHSVLVQEVGIEKKLFRCLRTHSSKIL